MTITRTFGKRHQQLTQDDSYRSGLRFARRLRLARIVGLAALFIPLASVLVSQFLSGVWWLLLVGWVFVWPHLARQLAFRSAEPNSSEIVNLKIDAIIAGVWMGLTGCSALPTAALIMMIGMNMMGSGVPVISDRTGAACSVCLVDRAIHGYSCAIDL